MTGRPRTLRDTDYRNEIRRRNREYQRTRRKRIAQKQKPQRWTEGRPDAPEPMLREAEQARNYQHETIVAELYGDPVPGRSALDKLTPEQRARLL